MKISFASSLNPQTTMDILFKCTACDQELSAEPAGAGTTIQCPACGESLVIPSGPVPPIASSAGAKEEKHFAVPQHAVTVALIEKPLASLEAAAHADKKVRVRTMRHSDCVEVGKDHFDEKVTAVLQRSVRPTSSASTRSTTPTSIWPRASWSAITAC